MKKLITTTLVIWTALNAVNAQNPLSFGIKAGFNGGFLTSQPQEKDAKLLPGFHIGAFGEYHFTENISVQPGILFGTRGTSIEHKDHHDDISFYTLDIPVQAIFRKNEFFAGGGLVLGYALSGHAHAHDSLNNEVEQELTFGSNPGDYKRLNYGVTATAGYELKNGLFFRAGIIYNLNNWTNTSVINQKFHVLQLGVGYRFSGK